VGGEGIDEGTFRLDEVDDPVSIVDQRRPIYPPVLQAAGIAGSVDVQFVVDTVGRAEAASWHVVGSTNRAFEEPAREAIMASRFKPARIKGRVVRQLVSQRISFTVGH
jgi:TonB family protein